MQKTSGNATRIKQSEWIHECLKGEVPSHRDANISAAAESGRLDNFLTEILRIYPCFCYLCQQCGPHGINPHTPWHRFLRALRKSVYEID